MTNLETLTFEERQAFCQAEIDRLSTSSNVSDLLLGIDLMNYRMADYNLVMKLNESYNQPLKEWI